MTTGKPIEAASERASDRSCASPDLGTRMPYASAMPGRGRLGDERAPGSSGVIDRLTHHVSGSLHVTDLRYGPSDTECMALHRRQGRDARSGNAYVGTS